MWATRVHFWNRICSRIVSNPPLLAPRLPLRSNISPFLSLLIHLSSSFSISIFIDHVNQNHVFPACHNLFSIYIFAIYRLVGSLWSGNSESTNRRRWKIRDWINKSWILFLSSCEKYIILLYSPFWTETFLKERKNIRPPFPRIDRCFDRWRHGKRGVVEKLRATDTRWAAKRSKYNWHASHPRRWNRRWNRERPIITHSKARRTVQRPSLDVERSCFGPPLPAGFYPPFSRGGGRVSR